MQYLGAPIGPSDAVLSPAIETLLAIAEAHPASAHALAAGGAGASIPGEEGATITVFLQHCIMQQLRTQGHALADGLITHALPLLYLLYAAMPMEALNGGALLAPLMRLVLQCAQSEAMLDSPRIIRAVCGLAQVRE